MSRTDEILSRLLSLHPKFSDLKLERVERLLEQLGRPQDRLPPVIHVAGTNGKGSTIAFMRAFLEASGKRVHVYTSPHLVAFRERIRLAGTLVSDKQLNAMLEHCEQVNDGQLITFFEITTAAAIQLFAETPADYLLLEVGMGGNFDSTNVIDHPFGVVIAPVALDHQSYLGDTLAEIAATKAGILKRGSPAVFARQTDEALGVLEKTAKWLGVTPFVAGQDFDGYRQDGRFVYQDESGLLDLPLPKLFGAHQIDNASLAIAAMRHFGVELTEADIATGLGRVVWPARLSQLKHGPLRDLLPPEDELWLDGSHNAHGATALSQALRDMNNLRPMPLVLIMGMMNTREPQDLMAPFTGMARKIFGLTIPSEENSHSGEFIADEARLAGFEAEAKSTIAEALEAAAEIPGARVVICGSLYLAGHVLAENETPPD